MWTASQPAAISRTGSSAWPTPAGTSLLGQNGLDAATAFASRPGTGLYQPADQYNSHRGARVAVSLQAGRGDYLILLPGSEGPAGHPNGGGGDVQVSAVGSNDDHCVIDRWTQQFTPAVEVHCYSNAGAPANTAFTIQWIVA